MKLILQMGWDAAWDKGIVVDFHGLRMDIPSGKHTKNYGKSPILMGKTTISMAIFNSYVELPEGKW